MKNKSKMLIFIAKKKKKNRTLIEYNIFQIKRRKSNKAGVIRMHAKAINDNVQYVLLHY